MSIKEPEIRKLTTESPFRSPCSAVINCKGFVEAYCFTDDSAMAVLRECQLQYLQSLAAIRKA